VLGVFTDIGTHPPKPPPLVELQRNPPGLRFFCAVDAAAQHINGNRRGMLYVPSTEAVSNLNSLTKARLPGTEGTGAGHAACSSAIAQSGAWSEQGAAARSRHGALVYLICSKKQ
jgi:hypothetical protein